MSTHHERITEALDELNVGLVDFVVDGLRKSYGDSWMHAARDSFRDERGSAPKGEVIRWDSASLLAVMWDQWNRVFKFSLGPAERSLVSELRDFRNRWAHQDRFDFDDTYRALDSVERLLRAVGATKQADNVGRDKRDLLRQEFSRETRAAYQKSQIRRKKAQDLLLYAICCISIQFAILQSLGWHAWFLGVFVIGAFVFIGWQRAMTTQPVFFGAHECPECAKIIYGDDCPYCAPLPGTKQAAAPPPALVPEPSTN